MKKIWIWLLLIISLTSCARHSSGGFQCTSDGQVCVYIHANQPIHYGEPVVITITVSSERDVPDLAVSMGYDTIVNIEGIENWEESLHDPLIWTGGAGWESSINANQTINFIRTLYLPQREGHFAITASIGELNSFYIINELTIVMTSQGGTVYLANTAIPYTRSHLATIEPFLLETLLAMPTYTPWPTLTPNPASTATPPAYPPPTSPPGDNPGDPYP